MDHSARQAHQRNLFACDYSSASPSAADAAAALAGGADLIDAKDPSRGALGAVSVDTLREIHSAVAGARPVTAALGEADNEDEIEHAARTFAQAATTFVKIGFNEGATRDAR